MASLERLQEQIDQYESGHPARRELAVQIEREKARRSAEADLSIRCLCGDHGACPVPEECTCGCHQ